jgi:hypothetical protein
MWGAEWQLHTEPMQTGTAALEHRKGSTSHQNNPGSPSEILIDGKVSDVQ